MTLKMLEVPVQFRPGTSITYPPFKNGKYLEEYVYQYLIEHKESIESEYVYIPIFWTNLQNHPGFQKMKSGLSILLQRELDKFPNDTKYFTVVQHDDGPLLLLPKQTIIFGACKGTIPIPLIYEDTTNYLLLRPRLNEIKNYLASFVGTLTHSVREKMANACIKKEGFRLLTKPLAAWTNNIPTNAADVFVKTTLQSKFCLAPRGYGRSSFRFFEAMLLDIVPVYFWDDNEWLPYKDILDYSTFSVSIHMNDIPKTYDILTSISEEKYKSMVDNIKKNRHWFTLEGLSEYIVMKISQ